jgi:phage gp29-like protein
MVNQVQLLDARGNPIRREALKSEPQTARTAHLFTEFSDHPSRGLTPAKLARILEDAEQGDLTAQAQLGEDMEEKDAHLFAELSKRRGALVGLDWDLVPPADATPREKDETARIEAMIRELDYESIIHDASAAILHGYACLEYDWDRSEGEWQLAAVDYRQPDWFMCQVQDRNTLRLRTPDGQGEELRPWGWLVHQHKAKSGYLVRGGLSRVLAWPYLFRNYSARDLAEFLEIHGLPLRLGKYPAGANEDEKATLMRAVVNIGHAAAGIIPQGMEIDFQEAAKGSSDPFMAMMRWAEESMSKAILGATLTSQTSDSGGGAYALGKIHNDVRHDILRNDAIQLARTLTRQLVMPLVRLNTRMDRLPSFRFDTELPEDLKLFSEAIPALVNVGAQIPTRWLHEKLHIPQPDGDEPVLASASPMMGMDALRSKLPPGTAALRSGGKEQAPGDLLADQLLEANQDGMRQWMETIEAMLSAASSLDEFREMLLAAQPELEDSALADQLGKALMAAEAAGRFDLEEESD